MQVLLATTMHWPFPAQLAGAFAGAGAQVEAMCPSASILAKSRHVARRHAYHLLMPDLSLRLAVKRSGAKLVIPCDDLAAEMVNRMRGEPEIGRQDFLTRAASAGAPVAASIAITHETGIDDAIRQLGLPLVVKCDSTWGGDGVAIAHSREEARQAVRNLQRDSRLRSLVRAVRRKRSYFLSRALRPVTPHITAQRFIAGHPATSAIACWNGMVVAQHHFDVTVSSGTGPASVITRRDCPRMMAAASAVAREFHLSGLFGLDYMRDANGDVHLLELNRRAVPTSHLALTDDLAAALLAAAGGPARRRAPVTAKDQIALFPREWLRAPASPWLKTAFHDVPWDDPAVVRACAQAAPADAQAQLQAGKSPALTPKIPVPARK